jgi:hypothetical protein
MQPVFAALATGWRWSHTPPRRVRSRLPRWQPKEPLMQIDTLARWHEIVSRRDAAGLATLLADAVVFHSPVVHTAQVGKRITLQYLTAALGVFGDPSFRYVRELATGRDAVLEFEVQLDGLHVNGVDMLRWDEAGRIIDFKVMLRPLKAVHLIHQKMAAMLAAGS